MRHSLPSFAAFLWAFSLATGAEQAKPIGPAEAVKKINEQVTLQMDVNAANGRERYCFLNSEENFRDTKNFTIYINKETLDKFKANKIENPAAYFKGKTVQVTGKVVLHNERPEIVLSSPDAIKIVADAKTPKVETEIAKLEGEWSMVSGIANGMAMPDEMVKTGKRVAKDGEVTISINGRVFFKAKYTIDASKKPATIDYDMTEGFTKGKKQLGIYKLEGDTVTFCFAAPGKDRPADFTSQEGSERTLSIWKRYKK